MSLSNWFVYILYSESTERTYVGITTDLARRLLEHNTSARGARYTKTGRPWRIGYFEVGFDQSGALKRELRLKKLSRKKKLELMGITLP